MEKSDIARLISELRKKSGQSQQQVSEKSKISFRTYQRIEAGEISPRIETVFHILRTLNADVSHLFLDWFKTHLNQLDTNTDMPTVKGFDPSKTQAVEKPMLVEDCGVAGVVRALSNEEDHRLSTVGYWEWNVTSQQFYWSHQMFSLYDMDPTKPFDHQTHLQKIHPEDLSRLQADLDELLYKNRKYENVHRILYGNGTRSVRAMAKKIRTKDNQMIVFGIAEKM